ncbi:hypothetical protein IWX92DRAFT_356670 [Phyllosticta citricarpa]
MVRPVQEKDTGLRPLYEPDDPQLDIVAIHGIGAHPYDTWVQRNEDGEKINWLENQDMLPAIAPHARIMRYGYRSAWFGSDRVRAKVGKIAERFLRALERKREECPTRPIIFVAHCFGGVVLMRVSAISRMKRRIANSRRLFLCHIVWKMTAGKSSSRRRASHSSALPSEGRQALSRAN